MTGDGELRRVPTRLRGKPHENDDVWFTGAQELMADIRQRLVVNRGALDRIEASVSALARARK